MLSPVAGPQPARVDDLAGICALLELCQLPAADLNAARLQHFLVLRDGTGLAGVAGLEVHSEYGLLRSVAIAQAHRSATLGGLLVSALEARAQTLKLKALYLLTTTATDYFARHGFRKLDRDQVPPAIQASTEFSRLCPSSAVCMVKRLES